jgi:hypothetical protein
MEKILESIYTQYGIIGLSWIAIYYLAKYIKTQFESKHQENKAEIKELRNELNLAYKANTDLLTNIVQKNTEALINNSNVMERLIDKK